MSSNKRLGLYIISLVIITLFIFLISFAKESDSSYLYSNKTIKTTNLTIDYPFFNNKIDDELWKYISNINNKNVDKVSYIVNYVYGYKSILFTKYLDNKIVDYDSFIFNDKNEKIQIDNIVNDVQKLKEKIAIYSNVNNISLTENIKYDYLLKSDELQIIMTNNNGISKNFNTIYINYNELDDILLFDYIKDINYQKVLTTTSVIPIITTDDSLKDKISKDKVIAFTFDDGPSKYTIDILNILDAYGAKATFFEVGYMMKNRGEIVKEVLARGHEIGNHTTDHSNLNKLSTAKIKEKVSGNNDIFKSITNQDFPLLRPPYGNCKESIRSLIDVPIIKWSVDSRDWESRNKDKIIELVKKYTKTGDIILFHDLYESTKDAIEVLVPYFYEQGYTIVTVSELFEINEIELEPSHVYYSAK